MGLINEQVEIKWNSYIKKYYENLGYIFTKNKDSFFVKIEDIPKHSDKKIDVQCDGCGNIFPVILDNYSKCSHSDGSYYCYKCAHNGNKKWVSFAEWGINEFGNDFLDKYWDYELNQIDPYEITKSCKTWIYIRCQETDYHGSYKIAACGFFGGIRCGFCNGKKIHKYDSLEFIYPEILKLWSDKNKTLPTEYAPKSHKKVWWKCENGIHDDYEKAIKESNVNNFRCPFCTIERDESFLQEKVRLYLKNFDVKVCHEQYCSLIPKNMVYHKKIKSTYVLKYDNEVIFSDNLRIFIEVHGIQHYELNNWHKLLAKQYGTTPKYEFEYTKKKDAYKKQYVLDNGFDYLEIPYWTDDNDETWKKLIDEKINEVFDRYGT